MSVSFDAYPYRRAIGWPRIRPVALVLFALLLPLGGRDLHALSFILIAIWAIFGVRHAIESLTLMWLLTFLNPALYSLTPLSGLLRWLVIIASFISIHLHLIIVRPAAMPKAWVGLVVFGVVTSALSFYSSYQPDVSLLKIASVLITGSSILWGFKLTRGLVKYWQRWFLSFYVVILVLSFPLIGMDVGYARNGSGFQGLTNHPQTYGVFLAPFLAWIFTGLLLSHLCKKIWWLIFAIGFISLLATESRTGFLAFIGGVFLGFCWMLVLKRKVPRIRILPVIVVLTLMLFLVLSVFARTESLMRFVHNMIFKDEIGSLYEEFQHSRGFLISRSWENFREYPLTGIGFGVGSEPNAFKIRRDPILGLPIGASVEKGFTVVAVLEETGLIGFTAFVLFIASLLRPALSVRRSLQVYALVFSCVLVNFGEAIFFALGGSGILVWLLLGYARMTKEAESSSL